MLVLWTILLACAPGGQAAIIPDQVVSFMHILYSTIPVIRKGTDSRVGFGFRFGPHADAQVLLELGPQKRTEKLTEITTTTASPDDIQFGLGKRHLDPLRADALPELEHNHIQGRSFQLGAASSGVHDPPPAAASSAQGGEWLSRWRAAWPGAAPSSAAPSSATTKQAGVVGSQRTGRGTRIALAPASGATVSASAPTRPPQRAQRPPPERQAPRGPTRPPATPPTPSAHLRDAMALLSTRTPSTRTPSPTLTPAARPSARPSTPPPLPRLPRQGAILRALRQLWEAGARAANYG